MNKKLKAFAAISVLVVTAASFVYYFISHPSFRSQIAHIEPLTFLVLLILYGLFTASLVIILGGTLQICRTKISVQENILVTIYSSIINFFGPLQSGPSFRAIYLKKRHGLTLKNYTLATLLYYGFFAAFSGLFLLSGVLDWKWIILLISIGVCCGFIALRSHVPLAVRLRKLNLRGLMLLGCATLLQVLLVAVIYFVELHSIDPTIHFSQAIVYTGAANFALFVSLTPGAIGFRESFLLFSTHLHNVPAETVLAASLLDRTFYVAFLGLLFIIALGFHAKERLGVRSITASVK